MSSFASTAGGNICGTPPPPRKQPEDVMAEEGRQEGRKEERMRRRELSVVRAWVLDGNYPSSGLGIGRVLSVNTRMGPFCFSSNLNCHQCHQGTYSVVRVASGGNGCGVGSSTGLRSHHYPPSHARSCLVS
jgi:hypothetical protein